ncbi:hypothetical protein JTB14_024967 [Gonioctena quinquepunctata]|nr:hypothetical protein JTB14_024967 [Gonioctena quinquepunctata]
MLDELSNWCNVWRVQLNPTKTQTVLFKHPNLSHKPSLRSEEMNLTLLGERDSFLQDEPCYLGVTFTRTLNWQPDLDKTLDKVRKRASIRRALGGKFGRCHHDTHLHTYTTYIRPILEYKSNIYALLNSNQESHPRRISFYGPRYRCYQNVVLQRNPRWPIRTSPRANGPPDPPPPPSRGNNLGSPTFQDEKEGRNEDQRLFSSSISQ